MTPLAILRPEPGASATANAARRLGLAPILIPLFQIEPVAWTAPDPSSFDGLLVTSANAVRSGGPELRKYRELPVHAVGEATAAEARKRGLTVQTVGNGGVDAALSALPPHLRLLHLCGAERREPRNHAHRISAIAVYRSAELEIPDNFSSLEGAVVAVHSPRAGQRLAELARATRLDRNSTAIAAISAEAAAAAGDGWKQVTVALEPSDRALLALAARLCQNADQ
jgi:uroporphyrinogen-III synthase